MKIERINTTEETVTVNLYQHWLGDQWIFVAEVEDQKGRKTVYDAHLNLDAQIVLTKTRYCDGRDHAWFRLVVKNHGNCHDKGYCKDWNRAVKSNMVSHFHAHHNNDTNLKLNKSFKGLDDMEIVFG